MIPNQASTPQQKCRSPSNLNSSARPVPTFLLQQQTFSTKKERRTPPVRPPPKPQIKTCPPRSRLFSKRAGINVAQLVTFVDSTKPSTLHESPLRNTKIYDSAKKVSYFEQAFVIESKIGAGCFGNVYRVRSKDDGHLYAVKIAKERYKGTSDRLEKLEEVRKHQYLLQHSNCVRFYQSWEENGRLYQQFELCKMSLKELGEEKHDLPEKVIWSYLIDLLLAVRHLHDNELIHMDIKPDNIFIGMDGICKLGDFGLVIDLAKRDDQHFAEGDPRYLAAEVLHERKFSKAADIFALGASMLEMASDLDLPAQGHLWHELRQTGPDPKLVSHLSADLKGVIQLMMVNDWHRRPTVHQLLSLPAVQKALNKRSRELAIENLRKNIHGLLLPIGLMLATLFTFFVNPVLNWLTYVFTSKRSFSTPEHQIRREKECADEEPSRFGTGIGSILKLVSFSSQKKVKPRREWRDVFSSDEDECDSSSSASVLASNLHYSDDEDFLTQKERTQGQLITDLGERSFNYFHDGDDSPKVQGRRRPINDLVKSTPARRRSLTPSLNSWSPKRLDFDFDVSDIEASPTNTGSKLDLDSSYEAVEPKKKSSETTIRRLNLASRLDSFSDSDEYN